MILYGETVLLVDWGALTERKQTEYTQTVFIKSIVFESMQSVESETNILF